MRKQAKTTKSSAGSKVKPRASSTADILGRSPATSSWPEKEVDPKWASNYRNLIELRQSLVNDREGLSGLASDDSPNYSLHMADAATDEFDRDFALSILSSKQGALYEIEEALRRIEGGTYGVCEMTGKPIGRQRLAAIPWTRFSVEAQKKIEEDGLSARPRLQSAGSVHASGAAPEAEEEPEEEG